MILAIRTPKKGPDFGKLPYGSWPKLLFPKMEEIYEGTHVAPYYNMNHNPEGPSTQYLRSLVPKTIPLGPESLNIGYLDPLGNVGICMIASQGQSSHELPSMSLYSG